MQGLFPIVRRVRRPLVVLADGRMEATTGGADAKPAERSKVPEQAKGLDDGHKATDAKSNVNIARK